MWKPMTAATALAATLALPVSGYAATNGVDEWNTDNQAGISSDEFRAGMTDTGIFKEWDANNDGMLSQAEFEEEIGENTDFTDRFGDDYFTSWDADNDDGIGEDELYEGAYSAYDADENNVIEEPEFGDLGDDIGDGGFWDV